MDVNPTAFPGQGDATDFTNVALDSEQSVRKKQPRRILHFSDGILEEYSTDEEEDQPPPPPPVDPKSLTWGPWLWHYTSLVGWKTYYAADLCGEKLAWFFGITSPKYQSAIDEFYRLKEEEEQELAREQRLKDEMIGLSSVDVSCQGKKAEGTETVEKF